MNSRIKDLALEVIVEHIASPAWVFNDKEFEKFSELIIKDCIAKIADEHKKALDDVMEDWDRGYIAGLSAAMETIKQNFGVE